MHKAAKKEFDELHERGQENLIRFLQLEVELAQTMGRISETTESPDHRARLLSNVREAIKAVYQFEGRIGDASIRERLHRDAEKLERFVDSAKADSRDIQDLG